MSGTTVYAVASGKGGVGKTTTTVNLGTALAGAGKRVAIVDADLGMANLAGFVSLSPDGPTLHDVLAGDADVPDATYEVADGIAAIPSGTELEAFADTDATGLGEAIDRLRGEFDYVLLDVGAGVSHESVLPLGIADEVLLVSTPEPASVQDVRKTIDLVDRAGGSVAGLVVTRGRPDGDVSHEEIASQLGVDLLGSIPEDPTARDSVYAGTPLVVHEPEAPAATAYRQLAATLADDVDVNVPGAAAESEADEKSDDVTEDAAAPDEPAADLADTEADSDDTEADADDAEADLDEGAEVDG
ncbi:cell division ATPase MinD, partial [Natronoarchaeum mannanilyticum]